MMRITLAALLALAPAIAGADALGDLRTTLVQLAATAPVHGTIEITSTSRLNEENKPESGNASLGFEANESGLRILYPRRLLAQAEQEARAEAIDPERATPARSGVGRVRPLHIADLLDGASALGVNLESAKLVDVKPVSFRGRPSRLVTLKLTPKMSKSAEKHLKTFESTLLVWIGDDGVPLAAEAKTHVKASFLLMSFEHEQKESWTYTRAGDRLVVTRYDDAEKSDGMGQHQSTQTTEIVRIE